jgi:hypothetical protein
MGCEGAALQSKICGPGVEAECPGASLSVSGFGTDSWIVFNKFSLAARHILVNSEPEFLGGRAGEFCSPELLEGCAGEICAPELLEGCADSGAESLLRFPSTGNIWAGCARQVHQISNVALRMVVT